MRTALLVLWVVAIATAPSGLRAQEDSGEPTAVELPRLDPSEEPAPPLATDDAKGWEAPEPRVGGAQTPAIVLPAKAKNPFMREPWAQVWGLVFATLGPVATAGLCITLPAFMCAAAAAPPLLVATLVAPYLLPAWSVVVMLGGLGALSFVAASILGQLVGPWCPAQLSQGEGPGDLVRFALTHYGLGVLTRIALAPLVVIGGAILGTASITTLSAALLCSPFGVCLPFCLPMPQDAMWAPGGAIYNLTALPVVMAMFGLGLCLGSEMLAQWVVPLISHSILRSGFTPRIMFEREDEEVSP